MEWNYQHRAFGVLKNPVRACLPNLVIALLLQKPQKFGGGGH